MRGEDPEGRAAPARRDAARVCDGRATTAGRPRRARRRRRGMMHRLRSIVSASRPDSTCTHNATARLAHRYVRTPRLPKRGTVCSYHSLGGLSCCTRSSNSAAVAAGRGRLHCCLNVAVPRRSNATSGPTTGEQSAVWIFHKLLKARLSLLVDCFVSRRFAHIRPG